MKVLHKCIGGGVKNGKKLVLAILSSMLALAMIMAGCKPISSGSSVGGSSGGQSGSGETSFHVTYDKNEVLARKLASGVEIEGNVPVDGNNYGGQNNRAVVLDFGDLKLAGNAPVAWVDGDGVEYAPGSHVTVDKDVTLYAKWDLRTNAITYENSDGVTFTGAKHESYDGSKDVALPVASEMSKKGYEFKGWFTTSGMDGSAVTKIAAGETGDKTFYAKWEKVTYTITYNYGSGSGTENSKTYDIETETITTPTATAPTDYEFVGWNTENGVAFDYVKGETIGNLTLVAIYKEKGAVSIVYEANGGSFSSDTQKTDSFKTGTVTLPTSVSKTGYTFEGWYTDQGLSTKVTEVAYETYTTVGSVTVYAKWIAKTYKVKFHANGGSDKGATTGAKIGGQDSKEVDATYDAAVTPPADAMTLTKYRFVDWSTSATENTPVGSWTNLAGWESGTVNVYGYWEYTWSDDPVSIRISEVIADATKRTGVVLTAAPTGANAAVATVEWNAANADILKITPVAEGTTDLTASIRIPYIADDGTQSNEAKTAGRGEAMSGYEIKIAVDANARVTVTSDKFLTQRIYFPDFLARSMMTAWGVGPSDGKGWFSGGYESTDTTKFTYQAGDGGNWGGHPSIKTLKPGTATLKAKPGATGYASYDVTVVVDENGWITWTNPPFPAQTKTVTAADLPGVDSITSVQSDNTAITATIEGGVIKLSATAVGGARISVNDGAITFRANAAFTGITVVYPIARNRTAFINKAKESGNKFAEDPVAELKKGTPMFIAANRGNEGGAKYVSQSQKGGRDSVDFKNQFQGQLTPEAMWLFSPTDLRKYTVIELHENKTSKGDVDTMKTWYEEQLKVCDDLGVPVVITGISALGYGGEGSGDYTFNKIHPAEEVWRTWLEKLIVDHPSIIGFSSTEHYWTGGDAVGRSCDWMDFCAANGLIFIINDKTPQKYAGNARFRNALQSYGKDVVVYCPKYTQVGNQAQVHSHALGWWMNESLLAWGILEDTWNFPEATYTYLGGPKQGRFTTSAVVTYPEGEFAAYMMQTYFNGGTVFSYEAPWVVYGANGEISEYTANVIAPLFKYFEEHPAPTRTQMLDSTKIILDFAANSGGNYPTEVTRGESGSDAWDARELMSSGRYGLVPAISSSMTWTSATSAKRLSNPGAEWHNRYPDPQLALGSDTNNVQGTVFNVASDIDWLIYNYKRNFANQGKDGIDDENGKNGVTETWKAEGPDIQYVKIDLGGGKTMQVRMTPHTTMAVKKIDGGLDIWMTNYRLEKSDGFSAMGAFDLGRLVPWMPHLTGDQVNAKYYRRDTVFKFGGVTGVTVNITDVQKHAGYKGEPNNGAAAAKQGEDAGETKVKSNANGVVTLEGNGWVRFEVMYN